MGNQRAGAQVVESPFAVDLDIPAIDIPSYTFHRPKSYDRSSPLYFDAKNPSVCFGLEEAELYVKRLAIGLQNLGLQPDDKVLLLSPNSVFFPIVLWGVLAASCVFTGASPTASVFKLSHQLRDSEAKVIFAAPPQLDIALKAAAKVGLDPSSVYVFDGVPASSSSRSPRTWTSIWAPVQAAQEWRWRSITSIEEAQHTTAVINYSSGTTGLPKGVELSHYNLVAQVEQILFKRGRVADSEDGRARHGRLVESGERWLAALPMYHAFGQTYYAMIAPQVDAKVFIMAKFNLLEFLTYIDIYRITFVNVVPTIVKMLAKVPSPSRFNLKSLQIVGSGLAPLDLEAAQAVNEKFLRPGVRIKQGWGMTETTCNVTGFSPDDVDDGRSIGWVNPTCRVRITPVPERDFSSIERERGVTVGEIWVAGPNVMKQYWKKPKETASTVVEVEGCRWVQTGDIGYADNRGCLYIIDRIKELIKVKGLQVSPAELEEALLAKTGVLDAAVVEVKMGDNEYPRAFVVRGNADVTTEVLDDLIKSKFAPHKWLTGGIFFIDKVPRSGIGKVLKRELPNPTEKRQAKI